MQHFFILFFITVKLNTKTCPLLPHNPIGRCCIWWFLYETPLPFDKDCMSVCVGGCDSRLYFFCFGLFLFFSCLESQSFIGCCLNTFSCTKHRRHKGKVLAAESVPGLNSLSPETWMPGIHFVTFFHVCSFFFS